MDYWKIGIIIIIKIGDHKIKWTLSDKTNLQAILLTF